MYKIGFLILVVLIVPSCQTNIYYDKYQEVDSAEWAHNQTYEFVIPIKDTLHKYNLFINLRNNKDYKYSNLFLITQMEFPNKTKVVDTLEYEMTNPSGVFLGSGLSDLKENKLFYKEKVQFQESGDYIFHIRHAMRERNNIEPIDPLLGITDIGISIEKIVRQER